MKIGIITVVFNEKNLIKPCIEQFDGFGLPHLVLVSSTPWRGDYAMDETWAIAKMNIQLGDVIVDSWADQAVQFNFGLQWLQKNGIDWALIVDADEFYTASALGQLIGQIRACRAEAISAPLMQSYWKTPEYRLFPEQDDNPIIAIRTDQRFTDKRASDAAREHSSVTMHHMSYVRSDEEMIKKINTFEHSHEFDKEGWFNGVWLPWTPDHTNLHPTVPSKWQKAIYDPAPYSIRKRLMK